MCACVFLCVKGVGNKLNNGVLSLISTVKEKQSYLGLALCQRLCVEKSVLGSENRTEDSMGFAL